MSRNVTLTMSEVLMACAVGVRRHMSSLEDGRLDNHGHTGAGWDLHLEGACGELVVAKALNIFWDGSVNTFKDGDDVTGYQVRTTSKHSNCLIIRKDDDPDAIFILVTGLCPSYRAQGWILGKDAMKDKWLRNPGGRESAYFVPQGDLEQTRPRKKTRK